MRFSALNLMVFLLTFLINPIVGSSAPPDWIPEPNLQYNMQIVAKLRLADNSFSNNPNDLVAGFVGTQCRGIGVRDPNLDQFIFITIGSNTPSGEVINFRAYLSEYDLEVALIQLIPFVSGSQVGTLSNPVVFTFVTTSNNITATAGANGSISPSGQINVPFGGSQLFTFTPNTGFQVANVIVDGVSVGAPNQYLFSGVTQNHTIQVTFMVRTYFLAYIVWANGSIQGNTYQLVQHGGNGTPVTVIPDQGYFFVEWDDGVTSNPRIDLNVTENKIISATLGVDSYTLTYTAGNNGSLSGQTQQTVPHGGNGSPVTAIPNTGFQFIRWSDGVYSNPRTDMNVMAEINVSAIFSINTFTINATAGANGNISPSGNALVEQGGDIVFTMIPNVGYQVTNVVVDGTGIGPVETYTFTNVTSNHSIHVTFSLRSYTLVYNAGSGGSLVGNLVQTVPHGGDGSPVLAVPTFSYHFEQWSDSVTDNPRTDLDVTGNINVVAQFALNTYTITATADANGSISPSGEVLVYEGTSPTFIITPNEGSSIADVLIDGVSIGPVSIYQFVNVVEDHTIEAIFEVTSYTLRYFSGPNGFLAGDTLQYVEHGGNGTPVLALSNPGYIFLGWSDGSYQNPRSDLNITENLSATALFTDSGPPAWTPRLNLEYNMQMVAKLMLPDSSFSLHPEDMVAAFSGLECRGIAHPFAEFDGLMFLTINSNIHTGEIITFKVYLENLNLIVNLNEIIEFVSMSEIGTMPEPFIFSFEEVTYLIQASSSANGTMIPEGQLVVSHGDTIAFTFTPNPGFLVKELIINGISIDPVNNYTFENVNSDNVIHVEFGLDTGIDLDNLAKTHVGLYPNPAGEFVAISIYPDNKPNENIHIELINIEGKLLRSWTQNENKFMLETGDIPPGLYLLKIILENQPAILKKFSKQ